MPDSDHRHGDDELAQTLRQLRQAAGLSGEAAGKAAGFSQAKISRMETGATVPTEKDVAVLAEVYRAPAEVWRRLAGLAADMRESNRRVVLNRGGTDFQARIARIEQASEHVRTFTPTVVPGLLQTAAYARAIFSSGTLSPAEVDAAVADRMERQQLLGAAGHRFTLLTTDGALGWCAGSPAVMAAQADRLAAAQPTNVCVGVIPWGAPATVFPMHTWDIYDQRGVIVGLVSSTALLTNLQDVAAYDTMFTALERMAVFGAQARAVFEQIAEQYRSLER